MRRTLALALAALLVAACGPLEDEGQPVGLWDSGGIPPWRDCQEGTVCEDGLCWTTVCGGSFDMGNPVGVGDSDEHPQRRVAVRSFEILQTEVTVEQYSVCVAQGACEAWPDEMWDDPSDRSVHCHWDDEGFDDHPMNCVDWDMAWAFCAWAGGSLPSEAQWEFAARSRGQDVVYPWGDAEPACDYLQMHEEDCCGTGTTCPVCSFPAGETEQGLCDMAGNIFEWTQDWYHDSYLGAPRTAEPWEDKVWDLRTLRGGAIGSGVGYRVRNRTFHDPWFTYSGMGIRCVREWDGVIR
jgi:formylglycine-generating enzyme required for sulfatase activity